MTYNTTISQYNFMAHSAKPTNELMVLVLEKAKNHLKAAKQFVENNDLVEAGKHIYPVVQILEGLTKTVTVREDIQHSDKIFNMYQTLTFQIENLLASNAAASEYDYFIGYFETLKSAWENHAPKAFQESSNEMINIDQSKLYQAPIDQEAKPVAAFNKDGRFEVIT